MKAKRRVDIDIVKELRLRRWARQYYVPADERAASWHPIVIEEMALKDDELLISSRSRAPVTSFVPLASTPIQRVHPQHQLPEQPKSQSSAGVRSPVRLPR